MQEVKKFVYSALAATALVQPVFANEVGDHCKSYAEAHHEAPSHCACLAEAADAHHELAAKIEQIHAAADVEHADAAVKEAVAACFAGDHH